MNNLNYGFIFPGQGSQSVGMLADIAKQYDDVQTVFAEASNALGYDLWELIQNGTKEKLDQTEYTQPALLASSYAIWRIIHTNTDIQPKLLAGHSLGEYTALACAGAFSFTDAVKLVAARGRFMQEAVREGQGAMAAIIGLKNAEVEDVCKQAYQNDQDVISPANFNSIGQVVVAGTHAAVMRAIDIAKEKGARMAVQIPVSVPSHCSLMKPAADKLAMLLDTVDISKPVMPVLNNVDAVMYESVEQIKESLIKQLYMPVRWVDIIHYYAKHDVIQIIECGPGKVLTGLNKRIDKSLKLLVTGDLPSLEFLLKSVSEEKHDV